MSKNAVLTDNNGEQIMPITTSENVFTGEGVTLKETLDNLSGGGGTATVTVDKALSTTSTNPVQNKIITAKINDMNTEMNSVKKSVSDGKELVATAITDKGVATEKTAPFKVMADNINKIQSAEYGVAGYVDTTIQADGKMIAIYGLYTVEEQEAS